MKRKHKQRWVSNGMRSLGMLILLFLEVYKNSICPRFYPDERWRKIPIVLYVVQEYRKTGKTPLMSFLSFMRRVITGNFTPDNEVVWKGWYTFQIYFFFLQEYVRCNCVVIFIFIKTGQPRRVRGRKLSQIWIRTTVL